MTRSLFPETAQEKEAARLADLRRGAERCLRACSIETPWITFEQLMERASAICTRPEMRAILSALIAEGFAADLGGERYTPRAMVLAIDPSYAALRDAALGLPREDREKLRDRIDASLSAEVER